MLVLTALCSSSLSQAQVLSDYNGDEVVALTAFGDSLTFGVGDGGSGAGDTAPFPAGPAGYPTRLSGLLGLEVRNAGVPGERLTDDGHERWPTSIQRSASDIVLLLEGTNDVTVQSSQTEYRRFMQEMVNVAVATSRLPVLMTLPPPCCNLATRQAPTRAYSNIIRDVASTNSIPLVDIEKVWDNNCPNSGSCDLYTQPEGLHPSPRGYQAMAQAVSATLLGIDILSPDGATDLEDALGLEPGSVIIVPDLEPVVMP